MAKTEKAVRLMKAVKTDGKWRWCRLALDSRDRLKPDVVILDGQEETHKEGRFGVFWKESGRNCFESAGKDFAEAQAALRRRRTRLNARLAGVAVPELPSKGSRLKVQDAIDDFLLEIKDQRAKKTHFAYRSILTDFLTLVRSFTWMNCSAMT